MTLVWSACPGSGVVVWESAGMVAWAIIGALVVSLIGILWEVEHPHLDRAAGARRPSRSSSQKPQGSQPARTLAPQPTR